MSDNNKRYKPCTVTCECIRTLPAEKEGENFRYLLKKEWKERAGKKEWRKPLIIIGCNPSTANEQGLDRTMRLIEKLIENKKYCGYIMLNLYPQIATRVGALPPDINTHIHAVNMGIIRKTLKENNSSNILFAFGKLIEESDYLYNICYVDVRKLIKKLIKDGVINNNQIKKLGKIDSETKNIKTFEYPAHFGNPIFYGNGMDNAEIVDFNIDEYDKYIVKRLKKLQSKKANKPQPKKTNKPQPKKANKSQSQKAK